jgi:hypothetical protein
MYGAVCRPSRVTPLRAALRSFPNRMSAQKVRRDRAAQCVIKAQITGRVPNLAHIVLGRGAILPTAGRCGRRRPSHRPRAGAAGARPSEHFTPSGGEISVSVH